MPFQENQNSWELAPQPGKFSVFLYISYISTSFIQISFSLGFKMLPYDPQ